MRQLNSSEAIKLLKNQGNNLLQSMQEGLIVLDPSGYVVTVTEAAGKLFGMTNHNKLLGKHFSELY
jgi:sensor histidine kinase regulating citrate/malate metabolism